MTAARRHGLRLRRVMPGRYQTLDGRYDIAITPGTKGRYATWAIWDNRRGVHINGAHPAMSAACSALADHLKGTA